MNTQKRWYTAGASVLVALALPLAFAGTAVSSSPTTVPLETTANFAILAASAITDVPTSTISGDVGLSPITGAAITGLTCAEVTGVIYTTDAAGPPCRAVNPGLLTTARNHQTAASVNAGGRVPDSVFASADNQLGGKTLVAGVYEFAHAATANLIGNLTLNGDADAVWIFKATTDFITAGSSTVTLTGGAQACNVFWKVPTTATLGGSSTLVGTVIADAGIDVLANATVKGRLFAGTAVTLISDTITKPSSCVTQAQVNAAKAAALAADQAAENAAEAAAVAAIVAADKAVKDAEAARVAAAAKAIADKAAADAAAAAAAAAQAAAVANVAAAKAAAVKAATAAKVAAKQAAIAKKAVARAKAKQAAIKKAHGATSTHARPARRGYGFTG
jgi:hypothetical protein